MYTGTFELDERAYEPEHIDTVLAMIEAHFPTYFKSFAAHAETAFGEAIAGFESDHIRYQELFKPDVLEEYEDDPGAFKHTMRNSCPIIRRCLRAPGEDMKKYKIAFDIVSGSRLLEVTCNIVSFGRKHMRRFNPATHECAATVEDLDLSDLNDDETYTAYGVIGGGIRSHFLYSLYPHAFPNRSQNAIWALYFLSGKQDFGLDDASEFLMIDINAENMKTQQNYFYPYDLFAFYALKIWLMLKKACAAKRIHLDPSYRYVYLDAFFKHVAETHQSEIDLLKGKDLYEFYDN